MTRKQLSQIFFLDRELRMWERELNELIHSSQVKGQNLDGMPFQNTNETSDKVAQTAIKIVELTETVEAIRLNVQMKINEADEFIATLDDSLLRQIIQYRCCKLMSWDRVAMMIGGGNTGDSVRMYYNRAIPKE